MPHNVSGRKTIAVLGAGIQGVLASLCLAERGHTIILIDREAKAVSKASLWNEGKIHLGYLFANDSVKSTARAMIGGAERFFPVLSRFVDAREIANNCSEPFTYAIPNDSLLTVEAIASHFKNVSGMLEQRNLKSGHYFELEDVASFHRLKHGEFEARFDGNEVQAAFQTREISVDTFRVASALRTAIDQHPKIEFRCSTEVERVADDQSSYQVVHTRRHCGRLEQLKADLVVNALWSDRLRIDASKGIAPKANHNFRYKLALHLKNVVCPKELSATTLMLGSYGDVVRFADDRMYLSWYPSCLQGTSSEIQPPDWEHSITDQVRQRVRRDVFDELSKRMPSLENLKIDENNIATEGGVIFSWGNGEISDLSDSVHKRVNIGIFNKGNYFSIDTGKYGMAPGFGEQLASVIDG